MSDQLIEKLGIDKRLVSVADIVEHFSRRFTLNYDVATSGINALLHFDLGYAVRLVGSFHQRYAQRHICTALFARFVVNNHVSRRFKILVLPTIANVTEKRNLVAFFAAPEANRNCWIKTVLRR